MDTSTPTGLDRAARLLSLLTDACKFCVLLALTAFAFAAFAQPDWARRKLDELGLRVKEIDAFGVKLVANDAFDMAKDLAEAKARLEALKTEAAQAGGGVDAAELAKVAEKLDTVRASLGKQGQAIKSVQQQAGMAAAPLPETGWVFVGRLPEQGAWQPGWSIDAKRTAIEAGQVRRLGLRADTVVLSNGNECTRQPLQEVQPPSEQDLQAPQLLLSGDAKAALEVLATASCPSVGKGQWIYAKVRVPADEVKFVKYGELLGKR